jgi:electron transfer flavoprotein beta subunit
VKIVVTVKQVPAINDHPHLDADNTLARDGELVLDSGDECAIEIALRLTEAHGGEVVLVSMGPPSAKDAVRRGLSMGADRAILIVDDQLAGADALQTARVLAAAIGPEVPDLVICGTESADGSTGLVPPMLAETLGLPQLTFATSLEVAGATVTVRRRTEDGYQVVSAALPAVVTVTAAVADPRYPSLKSIMAAKRKQVNEVGLASLDVHLGTSVESVEDIADAESRPGGEIVSDDGTSGVERILELLIASQVV